MNISKHSNNKAGTNKRQANWNFAKSSKIIAKFSFTGYKQTQKLIQKWTIYSKHEENVTSYSVPHWQA